jgi:pimeloyl-ACP methyl ester carboxylesterase
MTTAAAARSLRPSRTYTSAVSLGSGEDIPIDIVDQDRTRQYMVLHGGGGPATVSGFSSLLAERTHSRVLTPTHPGFSGTARPQSLASTRLLADAYVSLLDELDLVDVTVIGNSFGGWLAAEIALLDSPRVSGAIIVDGIGAVVEGHPPTDVSGLAPADLQRLSFHDPSRVPAAPTPGGAGPSPDIQALIAYTGPAMGDPTLLERVGEVKLPVHVVWGESDGIVDVDYGKAFAAAIPKARFTVLPRTGHLPQVETPEELLAVILGLGGKMSS